MPGFENKFIPAGNYNVSKKEDPDLEARRLETIEKYKTGHISPMPKKGGKEGEMDLNPEYAKNLTRVIGSANAEKQIQEAMYEISPVTEAQEKAQQETPKVIFERISEDIEKIRPAAAGYWLEKDLKRKQEIGELIRGAYMDIAQYITFQAEHTQDIHMKSDLDLKLQELRGILQNIPLTGEAEMAEKRVVNE